MNTYIVAYMNFYENNIEIEIVKAENKLEALYSHSSTKTLTKFHNTFDDARMSLLKAHMVVNVVDFPE
jgi:hypothetical protein